MRQYIILFIFIINSTNIISQSFLGYYNIGINGSQVSGDNLSGFDKIGINFGIGANRIFNENIFYNIEIKYIEKGSNNPKLHQNNITEINLSYIEIPVSFGIKTNKYSYDLGLSYGYLINSKEKDKYGEINNSNPFNNYDLSIFSSFEYKVKKQIFVDFMISNTILFWPIRNHASNTSLWYNQGQYNTVLAFAIKYYIIKLL